MEPMHRFLREPLVHFLLLGAALFGVFRFTRPTSARAAPSTEIAFTLEDVTQLAQYFQAQWGRLPTSQEFSALLEGRVREEVLYREALAMGLDQNDEIVRRRMAQKMEFLSEDVAEATVPTDVELRAWYTAHAAQYAEPRRVSFRHLYFSPDRRGARAEADARRALPRIAGQPEATPLGVQLADPFMFQAYYRDQTIESMSREFGPAFARVVDTLPTGRWTGPVQSGLGWHLVFVDEAIPGAAASYEEVQQRVRADWLAEQKEAAWDKAYRDMRAKYTVLLPGVPDSAIPAAGKGSQP